MTKILDWNTGQFRDLNREEKQREAQMLARLKENKEWKERARAIERIAIDDPNPDTIADCLKAFADWHDYAKPASLSATIAAQARKHANDRDYCLDVAAHWRHYKTIRERIGIVRSGLGIRAPWYFEHNTSEP